MNGPMFDCRKSVRLIENLFSTNRIVRWTVLFLFSLIFSYDAIAQLNLPSTLYTSGSTKYWQITWNCNTSLCKLEEQNGSSWTLIREDTRSYMDWGVGRPLGSHTFRLLRCTTNTQYGQTYIVYCSVDSPKTVTIKSIPTTPSFSAPTTDDDGVFSVSVSSVTDATEYIVQTKTDSGSWSSRTFTNAPALNENRGNGSHSYKVQACNPGGCSAESSVKTVLVAIKPGVPSSISIPSVTNGSFAVSWGSASGSVSKYDLDRQLNGGSWVNRYDGSSLSKSESVSSGTYVYRVRACRTTGTYTNCSNFRNSSSSVAKVPDSSPSLSLGSANTSGNYSVSWNTVSNASSYVLQEKIGTGGWATVQNSSATSKSFSGKSSNTYSYRLQACNALGCAAFSAVKSIDVALPPAVPGSITVPTSQEDGIYSVNWSSVSGATKYQLQRQPGSSSWSTVVDSNTTSREESGLAAGSYTYRVLACKVVGAATGCSGWRTSNAVTVAAPASAPVITLPQTSGNGSYTVSWSSVSNTTQYELQENPSSGNWAGQTPDNLNSKAYSKGNGTFIYRVRACNAVGCSNWSSTKTVDVALKPGIPVSIAAPEATENYYTVSWGLSSGSVTNYKLERLENGSWSQIYSQLSPRSFSEAGSLTPGTYKYRVMACSKTRDFENCSDWRTSGNVIVAKKPDMPLLGFIAEPGNSGGVYLDWTAVAAQLDDPFSYFILEYQINGGAWVVPVTYTGTATNYSLPSIANGQHQFSLRACLSVPVSTGTFDLCSNRNLEPPPVARPASAPEWDAGLATGNGTGTINLGWTHVTDTSWYEFQQKSGSNWVTQASPSTNSYTLNNKPSGIYQYRLRACNGFGCSDGYSSVFTVNIARKPDVPEWNSNPALSDGNHLIRWIDVNDDVTHYVLQVSTNNGSTWSQVLSEDVLSKNFMGLSAGAWLYRVAAFNTVGGYTNYSAWSTTHTVNVAAPTTPQNVRITNATENNFNLAWNTVLNTSSYQITEVEGGSSNNFTTASTNKSFSDKPENTYSYSVKACNQIGCSTASAPANITVVITPGVPGSFTATANNSLRTSFVWGAATGSPSFYQVQQRFNSGAWSASENFNGLTNAWPVAVTTVGTYQYQVRACRTMGSHTKCSDWILSNSISYSVPGVPNLQVSESISSGSFRVNWNAVTSADHYILNENGLTEVLTGTSKSFSNSNAKPGGRYTYKIQACNQLGCGGFSNVETVTVRAANDNQNQGGGNNDGANVVSLPPSGPVVGDAVGPVRGEFRVNESGAATYSVPLSLPIGTAGVAPELSFGYSSQGSAGSVLGYGWSLAGLSGISRCRQTLAQDGQALPITWSADDRFCLDGQRLVLDEGSSYGAVGAKYKTEIDSFVSVTSHGGTNGQPNYFSVVAKDGSITTYGGTGDSKLLLSSKTLTWMISRIEDSVKNRIDFYFEGDSSTGQRVLRIDYAYPAPNSSSNPQATIEFNYQNRGDGYTSFVDGYAINQTKRLDQVIVKNTVSGVQGEYRRYNLDYQADSVVSTDLVSRLESIEECVISRCLKKTRFTWPEISSTLFASTNRSELVLGNIPLVMSYHNLDINADGMMDLVWIQYRESNLNNQYLYYSLARPDGGYGMQTMAVNGQFDSDLSQLGSGVEIHVVDYNGDGRQDVIARQKDAPTGQAWDLFLAVAEGDTWRLKKELYISLPFANEEFQFGDVNSDGMVDAYYIKNNQLRVHYQESTGTAFSSNRLHYRFSESYKSFVFTGLPTNYDDDYWTISRLAPGGVGDFNGDGRVDFVAITEYFTIEWHTNATVPGPVGHGKRFNVFTLSNNQLLPFGEIGVNGLLHTNMPLRIVDLNGDGLSDAIYERSDSWSFMLSKGEGFTEPQIIEGVPEVEDKKMHVADINRDGYLDLVYSAGASGLRVRSWTPGQNRFSTTDFQYAGVLQTSEYDHYAVIDVNGDGWNDIVQFQSEKSIWSSTTRWKTITANQQGENSPNLITKITDGMGNEIDISYELLTNSDNYSRVDVGEVITQELDEVCNPHPRDPNSGSVVCYTPIKHTINTNDFYLALNDPFSTLPEGNDSLGELESPVLEIYAPIPIVTNVGSSAPLPGDADAKSEVSYFYDQMKFQAAGRGALGFRKLITLDHQTSTVTETTYRQDWPFVGSPLETIVKSADGSTLSHATNTWELKTFTGADGTKRYQTNISSSVEESFGLVDNGETQGDLLKTVTTSNTFDDFGNPETIEILTEGAGETITKLLVNSYGDDWNKQFGRLTNTTVTTTRGMETQIGSSDFTYIPSGEKRGLLLTEVASVGTPFETTTTYSYDAFGNKVSAIKEAADGTSRDSDTTTYVNGRYTSSVTNALGQVVEEIVERNIFGQPTLIRNINDVETSITYDDLGMEYLRLDETGAWSWQGALYCDSGIDCPANAVYRTESRVAGGGISYAYYDRTSRTIRESAVGFNGVMVNVDTEYDNLSRVKRVSTPYFTGGYPVGWAESEYDILGRIVNVTAADGQTQEFTSYNGYSTTLLNALGQTKTETRDLAGNLVGVLDNLGGTISYQYDLGANLTSATTTAPGVASVRVRMCYDELGRKTAMHDPDKGGFLGNGNATCDEVAQDGDLAGWWYYSHNGVGELVTQKDSKGQIQSMAYDALGRMIRRTDYHSNGSVEGHTRWYFDTDMDGDSMAGDLGNVTYVVQSYGVINESCSANNHCTANVYDALGRPTDSISFLPGENDVYVGGVRYDSIGRPYRKSDVMEGLVHSVSGTRQHYNEYGFESEVTDLASGELLYRILQKNTRGQVVASERGNGATTVNEYDPYFGHLLNQNAGVVGFLSFQDISYVWDKLGNLESRHNQGALANNSAQKDLKESFCYDGLNRLLKTHSDTLFGNCTMSAASQDVEYNGLGNITRKAGVGSYSYGSNAGPHAVTQAGSTSYSYDNNGNMTGGDGRSLSYSTYDKAVEISKNNHTSRFTYGPDRGRFKRVDVENGVSTTTLYLGNVERIYTDGSSKVVWRRNVAGAAFITETDLDYEPQNQTEKNYIYKDHLGSTDVITDSLSHVVESQSFDVWGQRRNSQDWTAFNTMELSGFESSKTRFGFTGHEHLDDMGLVHMNGRIYDAKLGRFLQADPFIQAASDTQSFNRYTYLLNNPLNATDPSGFFLKKLWDEIRPFVGAIVGIILAIYCGPCGASVWGAMGAGAAAGAAGAAANGGNVFKGALFGAVSGAVFYGIGVNFTGDAAGSFGHVLAHATAGGVMSVLQGGKFGHGFVSAGLTKAANINRILANDAGGVADGLRTAVAAIVGGTISKITGGKFANGAMTAAMAQAFNGNNELEKQLEYKNRLTELRMQAAEMLNAKPQNANEWGVLIQKDENGELFLGGLIEGEKGHVPFAFSATKDKKGNYVWSQPAKSGGYEVVEIVHLHPTNSYNMPNWKFSAGTVGKLDGDVAMAKTLNVNVTIVHDNTIRVYDPSVESGKRSGRRYEQAEGELKCRNCF